MSKTSEAKNESKTECHTSNQVLSDIEDTGDITERTDLALSLLAQRFTDSTTMHGIRYMFMREAHFLRRIIWACVVLGGLGYCMYIVYDSCISFYSYPTTVQAKTIFEAKSVFPTVTICPYNTFQKSALTTRQLNAIQQVFGGEHFPSLGATNINLTDFDDIDITELYRNASYKFPSNYCQYKQRVCRNEMISSTLTDYGFCRVYDVSNISNLREQNTLGQSSGLDMAEILNDSEWTIGPHFVYDGFRVAIHPAGTRVHSLRDKGFSLLPGFTTEVAIRRREVTLLPPPFGQCGESKLAYFANYSREHCLLECETNHTVAVCGCRYVYMPGETPKCTISKTASCHFQLTNPFGNLSKLFDQTKCNCPQECKSVEFLYEIIHTAPTKGYTDFLLNYVNLDLSAGMQMRVYYQDLQYTVIEQVSIYSWENLICDIGGAAGLFLGCSFVTIVEFFDFVGVLFWISGIRQHNKNKKKDKPETNQTSLTERIKSWLFQAQKAHKERPQKMSPMVHPRSQT